MKLTTTQIESLVRRVLSGLENKKLITFASDRDKAIFKGREIIAEDYKREAELDAEVERMMDDLERDNTENFQRHRMFNMLKKKVADERGFVL